MSTGLKLFVGGLSWSTDSDGLRGAFERFGDLIEAKVIVDRDTNKSRGFGFVTYARDEDAEQAIDEMNGTDLDGRTIRVDKASDGPGRGSSRGGPDDDENGFRPRGSGGSRGGRGGRGGGGRDGGGRGGGGGGRGGGGRRGGGGGRGGRDDDGGRDFGGNGGGKFRGGRGGGGRGGGGGGGGGRRPGPYDRSSGGGRDRRDKGDGGWE